MNTFKSVFSHFSKKTFIGVSLSLTVTLLTSCELLEKIPRKVTRPGYTESDIVAGLKEALDTGVDIMVDSAALSNGFWKRSELEGFAKDKAIQILLPEDVQTSLEAVQEISSDVKAWKKGLSDNTFGISDLIVDQLDIGFIKDVEVMETLKDSLWKSLNQAAEHAAPASKDLFVQAISDLSIDKGSQILFSEDSAAATLYLQDQTLEGLNDIFQPIISKSMDAVKANQLWNEYSGLYNSYIKDYKSLRSDINSQSLVPQSFKNSLQLPDYFPESLPEDLSAYTTQYALSGLFNLVSQEEYRIRENPFQYASDLIEEIFTLIEDEINIQD